MWNSLHAWTNTGKNVTPVTLYSCPSLYKEQEQVLIIGCLQTSTSNLCSNGIYFLWQWKCTLTGNLVTANKYR